MTVYDLIYRIQAKIGGALQGFGTISNAYGRVRANTQLMSRDMEKTLTLQKLARIGFAYVVARSLFDIMTKSTIMQSYLQAWGTILGALLDVALAPWIPVLTTVTQKLADLLKWFQDAPEPLQAFAGGILMASAVVLGLGAAIRMLAFLLAPFKTALSALGITIVPLAAAFTMVGAALGGFLAGYWTNWLGIRDRTDVIIESIKEKIGGLPGAIIETLAKWPSAMFTQKLMVDPEMVLANVKTVADTLMRSYNFILNNASGFGVAFITAIATPFNVLPMMAAPLLNQLVDLIKSKFNAINANTSSAMASLKNIVGATMRLDLLAAVSECMVGIERIFNTYAPQWLAHGVEFVTNLVSGINQRAYDIWNTISGHLSSVAASIRAWVYNAVPELARIFMATFADGFRGTADRIMSVLSAELSDLMERLRGWAESHLHFSPYVSDIPRIFTATLNRGFAAAQIQTPALDMSKTLNMRRIAENPFNEAPLAAGGNVSKIEVTHHFDMPISIPITATIREEGKSIDEIAEEVATKFYQRFRSITG